jgi:uncharacterized protein (TIGR03083 family)
VQDRKGAIRHELLATQQALLGVLDRVEPTDWQRASPNEGWTIQHLLTHLSTSEHGFVGTVRRLAAGEGGLPSDFDPNRWNAGQLQRNAEALPGELRQRLETAHAEMLELLNTLDDAALDRRGLLSTGQEGSTEDCLRLLAAHKRTHTEDIRAALSLAGV